MEGCFEGCFQGGGGDMANGVEGPAGDSGFFTFRLARRGLVFRVLGTRGVGPGDGDRCDASIRHGSPSKGRARRSAFEGGRSFSQRRSCS